MKNSVKFICISLALLFLLQGCGKKDDINPGAQKDSHETVLDADEQAEADSQDDGPTKVVIGKASDKKTTTSGPESKPDTGSSSAAGIANNIYASANAVNAKQESQNGLTRKDGILIVNKTYSIPADYNPGVDSRAQSAFDTMAAEAQKEGINLFVVSGFRSYETQENLYNNYVAKEGGSKDAADRYSARPGHSEHQSGLAFDVNSLSQSFEDTPEGKWLAANCYKYGFIIRFPKGKESITGYMYEPWHVRYIENGKAEEIYRSGKTLEEYLGITSVYAD